MDNLYKSEVLIYTEDLPQNINASILQYMSKEEKDFRIVREQVDVSEKDKFPDAKLKFSIIGDCVNWSEEFRQIIRLLRKYTISVLII